MKNSRCRTLLLAGLACLAASIPPAQAQSPAVEPLKIEKDRISAGVPLNFGSKVGPHLQLYDADRYSIGIQGYTMYFRTDQNFAWYRDGAHAGNELDPGNGTTLMTLAKKGEAKTELKVLGKVTAESITVGDNRIEVKPNGDVSIGNGALVVDSSGTITLRAQGKDVLKVTSNGELLISGINAQKGVPTAFHVFPDGGVHLGRMLTWPGGKVAFRDKKDSDLLVLDPEAGSVNAAALFRINNQPVVAGGILARSYLDDSQAGCAEFGAGDCSGFVSGRKDYRPKCKGGFKPQPMYSARCDWTQGMAASGGGTSGGWCYLSLCQSP